MIKNKKIAFVLFLFALMGVAVISVGQASVGLATCYETYKVEGCWNGGCNMPESAEDCCLINCWCNKTGSWICHDCHTGEDNPTC